MRFNPGNHIRLFLTISERLYRDVLLHDWMNQEDIELVGEAETGSGTLNLLMEAGPSTLIIEENLRDNDGLTIAEMALQLNPSLIIILLVDSEINRNRLSIYLDSGIKSVVSKTQSIHDLSRALNYTRTGQIFIDAEHYKHQLTHGRQQTREQANESINLLSDREQEVAQLMAQRVPVMEIASQLGVSHKTIHTYKERILTKLNLQRLPELIVYMRRLNIKQRQDKKVS